MSPWVKRGLISLVLGLLLIAVYFMWLGSHIFDDHAFLTAVLNGDDSLNAQYLSSDFQKYVIKNCPDEKASTCMHQLIKPEWGTFKSVKFGVGSGSTNSELYYSSWSNNITVVIVLLTAQENGKQVYTGWRGFIPSEGEDRDAELLSGKRRDNQFPHST